MTAVYIVSHLGPWAQGDPTPILALLCVFFAAVAAIAIGLSLGKK